MDENAPIKTLSYLDLKGVCRICLKNDLLYNIYSLHCGNISIKAIIENVTGDTLNPYDETPDKICYQCLDILMKSNLFLLNYNKTKSIYNDVIKNLRELNNNSNNDNLNNNSLNEQNTNVENPIEPISNENDLNPNEGFIKLNFIQADDLEEISPLPKRFKDITNVNNIDNNNANEYERAPQELNCNFCNINTNVENVDKDLSCLSSEEKEHYLKDHSIEISTDLQHIHCKKCERSFINLQALFLHLKNKSCKFWIDNKQNILNEIETEQLNVSLNEQEPSEPSYNCLKCNNLSLNSFKEVLCHFHDFHGADKDNTCILCSKTVKKKLFLHYMDAHRPEMKRFYCKLCFLLFETENDLKMHKTESDHYLNLYKCPCCKARFFKKSFFEHFAKQNVELIQQVCICKVCNRNFELAPDLYNHFIAEH